MMGSLLNLHTYWMVNIAIALSYPLAKVLISLPFFNKNWSQQHQLAFARFCFIIALTAFLIMPLMTGLLSIQHSDLEFKPVIHHASMSFLRHHETLAAEISSAQTLSSQLSLSKIILFAWLTGFLIFTIAYLRTLMTLKKLQRDAFCRYHINNVHILFSHTNTVPFCWSFFQNHYIIVPDSLLEKREEMQLAIRHELQHIRQGDTHWLQIMMVIKLICFWNPFLTMWLKWLSELQEFACDEGVILRRKTSPTHYAQCLINTARNTHHSTFFKQGILAINGMSPSLLYRRVNMLFGYKNQKRKFALIIAYSLSACTLASAAYALNGTSTSAPLTTKEVASIIRETNLNNDFHISATPEVLAKINLIRSNQQSKKSLQAGLERMKTYQPYIESELKKKAMPTDLLVIPLIESRYKPLEESQNVMRAAGIWQIIPSTAKHFGLVISPERDDRLDTQHSTQAALTYLSALYEQFHDWKLAALAYEIGENETARLINATGSRDAWTLARSSHVPDKYKAELKEYLAMIDASIIIMHKPSLITQ